ncbi:protein STU1-like [Bubalus bubalis]|uniref:protein STU1-like n=1 Tax=Bubalus bubalis TaxID=89462 RepID=UPI001D107068|nr:protein STU1-like [Bubalus bubalis]
MKAGGQPPRRGRGAAEPARFAHGVHVGPPLSAYLVTPKLHPWNRGPKAPGGRVNPASPLPVPATPASGLGRPGLSPPLLGQPRREAGQVLRALPKALKSKTVATPGELKQVGLRFSSAAPLPLASAGEPAESPHPSGGLLGAKRGGGLQPGAQLCAPGQSRERRGERAAPGCLSLPAEPSSSPPTEPTPRSRSCQRLSAPSRSTTPAAWSPSGAGRPHMDSQQVAKIPGTHRSPHYPCENSFQSRASHPHSHTSTPETSAPAGFGD